MGDDQTLYLNTSGEVFCGYTETNKIAFSNITDYYFVYRLFSKLLSICDDLILSTHLSYSRLINNI